MTTCSSVLAYEIPWTEEPGRLQSMGSQKSQTWLCDSTTTEEFTWDWGGQKWNSGHDFLEVFFQQDPVMDRTLGMQWVRAWNSFYCTSCFSSEFWCCLPRTPSLTTRWPAAEAIYFQRPPTNSPFAITLWWWGTLGFPDILVTPLPLQSPNSPSRLSLLQLLSQSHKV